MRASSDRGDTRRVAQVTRNLLPRHLGGHALNNLLPELGVLGFLAVALASAVFLVRRGRSADDVG